MPSPVLADVYITPGCEWDLIVSDLHFLFSTITAIIAVINAVKTLKSPLNKTPLLFLRATIKVVGKYNTYLSETNAEVVFNYLQFLTAFIDVPQCIKYVSKALYLLTSETIRFMKTNPTPLQQIYQKTIQSVMAGKLQGNEKIYERN